MQIKKIGTLAFSALTMFAFNTPVLAAQQEGGPCLLPGQAHAQVLVQPQAGPPPPTSLIGELFTCNPANATATYVNDGSAGLVSHLQTFVPQGFNSVQSGLDIQIPAGGLPDNQFTFVWKPLNGTTVGCNQGLYWVLVFLNPGLVQQSEIIQQNYGGVTTGPDANGYFTTTYSVANGALAPGFQLLRLGLLTTDNGRFNIKSANLDGNDVVFDLHNRKAPHIEACPFGSNHADFNFDFYCGI